MKLYCEHFSDMRGYRDGFTDNIPFEALAVDLTRLPEVEDALDLTRCVIWALRHPSSGLAYPREFVWLTSQLGGPVTVQLQTMIRWCLSGVPPLRRHGRWQFSRRSVL